MTDNHIGILGRIQLVLKIQGFSSQIIDPTEDNPVSTLVVTIDDPKTESGSRGIELRLVPSFGSDDDEGEKENLRIQFYSQICDGVAISNHPELFRFILSLNAKLPLIGFHYSETLNMVFFHNFTTLSKDQPVADDQIVVDVTYTCAYILNTFGHMMLEVATGQKLADQLINEVAELYRPK